MTRPAGRVVTRKKPWNYVLIQARPTYPEISSTHTTRPISFSLALAHMSLGQHAYAEPRARQPAVAQPGLHTTVFSWAEASKKRSDNGARRDVTIRSSIVISSDTGSIGAVSRVKGVEGRDA